MPLYTRLYGRCFFFSGEGWRTPKTKGQAKKKPLFTSTPVHESNMFSCLGVDDSDDVDYLLDELDFQIPKSRSKRRRKMSRVVSDDKPSTCKYFMCNCDFKSCAEKVIT